MNLRKQQAQITDLYRRGEIIAAKEGFEDLVLYCEETEKTDLLDYWEALLGLGSLELKDMEDQKAAEKCWQKLVNLVNSEDALELDPETFDVYTQALLLLAFVQRDLGKLGEAGKNLKVLRDIAVETRGEKSDDVKAIDEHLASLQKN